MSLSRFAALWVSVAVAGCYSNAPPQSTTPEPQYFSGPPGGAFDPGSAYASYGRGPGSVHVSTADPGTVGTEGAENDAIADGSEDPGPPGDDLGGDVYEGDQGDQADSAAPARAPLEAAPEVDGSVAPGPDQIAQVGPGEPAPPADPTAGVTDVEIQSTLDGYGQWVESDDYGPVWRPDATVVGVDFTPYASGGSWAYTDAGWAFASEYPWGWLPFHYGRWAWFHDSWGWVPGHRWGPAWVEWRHGGGVVGWRPQPPVIRDHRRDRPGLGGGPVIRDHRHASQHDAHWRFATVSDFARPHVRSHLYGNAAEGLAVTSVVAAPPVRARTTTRAGDLMRSRFAGPGWRAQPGSRFIGPAQVRDHRGYEPGLVGPAQVRDHRGRREPGSYPPSQAFRTYQPPIRPQQPAAQTFQPGRTYQPPGRTYQPPVRTYQPPIYQPPARTFQPGRTYQPPVRTYQPPVRTYQPPIYQPPARTYQPPIYQPPARTYQPPPVAAPPARTWTPPSAPPSAPHPSSPPSGGVHGGGVHPASGGLGRRR